MNYIVVITVTDSLDEAKNIANILVKEELIACAQISNIESTYIWNNNLENTKEYKIEMKTKKELYNKIENKIKEIHHYELPEIISYNIDNLSKEYANWIDENTKDITYQI